MEEFLDEMRGTRDEEKSGEYTRPAQTDFVRPGNSSDFRIRTRGDGFFTPGREMEENVQNRITVDSIRKSIFSPINNAYQGNYTDNRGDDLSTRPRSLRMVANENITIQSAISDAKFLNKGPPMLPAECNLKNFHDWQRNIRDFISKVPGYELGILTIEPDFEFMREADQKFLVRI